MAQSHAPRVWEFPRKRRCARTRFTQMCAWVAPVKGVRGVRCASLLVCSWLQSPREPHGVTLYRSKRFSAAFRLVFLHSFFARYSAGFRLCASAHLRLLSALRHCVSAINVKSICFQAKISKNYYINPNNY